MDTPAPITTTHYLYFAAGGSVEIRRQHDNVEAARQFARSHAQQHGDSVKIESAEGVVVITPEGEEITVEELAARIGKRMKAWG